MDLLAKNKTALLTVIACLVCLLGFTSPQALAEPFKLNASQKQVLPGDPQFQGQAAYPKPQAYSAPYQGGVQQGTMQGGFQAQPPMQGQIQQRPPMRANIQRSVPLPPQFLGHWLVKGQRQGFEAQPQFRAAIPRIFNSRTENTWMITGNPQAGYAFSNKVGAKSPMIVQGVQGNTAYIRYAHPIKNTVAQEAIVMELSPDGRTFKGLERITIVKKGEPPRAKVTYKIFGVRQR